jgi:hypothetical protein
MGQNPSPVTLDFNIWMEKAEESYAGENGVKIYRLARTKWRAVVPPILLRERLQKAQTYTKSESRNNQHFLLLQHICIINKFWSFPLFFLFKLYPHTSSYTHMHEEFMPNFKVYTKYSCILRAPSCIHMWDWTKYDKEEPPSLSSHRASMNQKVSKPEKSQVKRFGV